MAVSSIKRAPDATERDVETFIAQGGEFSGVVEPEKINDEIRITFRCPKELINKIDLFRKAKPGRLSRNQALIEVLDAFLSNTQK